MGIDFDPHRQAEAAMKEAAHADGFERQRWIETAQAWLELPFASGSDGPSKQRGARLVRAVKLAV
jgi:hypothetical protein